MSVEPAAVTAVGSFASHDVDEVVRIVAGEFATFPVIPELPARGPGADMIGRCLAMLADVSGEFNAITTVTGWQLSGSLTSNRGSVIRRAASWLNEDLDRVEEQLRGYRGPLKVGIAGPWTLAAAVEDPMGHRLLADAGLIRDLGQAMGEAIGRLVANLARRIPDAELVVQLDEPGVDAVRRGEIPTASGRGRIAPIADGPLVEQLQTCLGAAAEAGAQSAIHCCSSQVPVDLLRRAGADWISLDLTRLDGLSDGQRAVIDEELGQFIEAAAPGAGGLIAGLHPSRSVTATAAPLLGLSNRTGIGPEQLTTRLAISPTCGIPQVPLSEVPELARRLHAVRRGLLDQESPDFIG